MEKQYKPSEIEPRLEKWWQENGIHNFEPESSQPIYSIDTPPPTVSGHLHLGHVYSYTHADLLARFFRMNGYNVFYPMGFDDNGLPTERLVEKRLGIRAQQVGRQAFIVKCLELSQEFEQDYRALWERLGLSIDWRHTYRTIDDYSRRAAQLSFIDLYERGLAYRVQAPNNWCSECQTAIAQAELEDVTRRSEFVTLPFDLPDGSSLPIATTRPELLAACVAVFIHPQDKRYTHLAGGTARVPFYHQEVPILTDPAADPAKGTGAVMCCTFGDQTDVAWWQTHHLPLVEAVNRQGCMTSAAGPLDGLRIHEARQEIKQLLGTLGLIIGRADTQQSIRAHDRCDTPVEYISTPQWFVRVLDVKTELLTAGEQITWHPEYMGARYRTWVENLTWDWCISRQRAFGVPFPVWYCQECGAVRLANPDDLPMDPLDSQPAQPCACGSFEFTPDTDVMDTWATSSLSPQIIGRQLTDPAFYERVFPMSLRPQAHEIIRTWAFYTIVQSWLHWGAVPWKEALISGWGIAGEGMGKISKSRGGGPMAPMEMIERYSADALRYWAASGAPGRDLVISEEKIQAGTRLATKLWNVARFSQPFLLFDEVPADQFTPADNWILARLQVAVREATDSLRAYEYANAKNCIEEFFWHDLADNYIEMAKQRLYAADTNASTGARSALTQALLKVTTLLAPFMPYITEAVYQQLFTEPEGCASIHRSHWPKPESRFDSQQAIEDGALLVEIASTARRHKSEHNLSLGSELNLLQLAACDSAQAEMLRRAQPDLTSITRARQIDVIIQPGGSPGVIGIL